MAKDQRAKKLHEFYLRSGAISIDNTNELLMFKLSNLYPDNHSQNHVAVNLKGVAEKDWMRICLNKLVEISYWNGQQAQKAEVRTKFFAFTDSIDLNINTNSE